MRNGRVPRSLLAAALLTAACSPPSAARLDSDAGTDARADAPRAEGPEPRAAIDAPGPGAEDAESADAESAEDVSLPLPTGGPDVAGGAAGWPAPPMVIAVGNDGRHAMSLDGIRWTDDVREAMGNRDTGVKTLRAAAYARGTVVAVGGGCNPDCLGRIVIFDGNSWSEVPVPPGQGRLDGVAYGAGVWLAVGTAGPVLRSSDEGRTWVPTGFAGMAADLRAVAFGAVGAAEMFVAVGEGYLRMRSADGISWTDVQPATGASDGFRAVAIGNGVVVAVGGKGGAGRRIRSTDGAAWTDEITGGPDLLSLVHADGRFWAFSGSGDNTMYHSLDGKSWTTENTTNAGANVAEGMLAGGRLFVSRVSPSTIKTSADGITWATRLQSIQGDATINAFVFVGP